MNTKKQKSNQKLETPNSKLQKSSVIFMQLGLIIALLAVYFTLEHKSFINKHTYADNSTIENIDIEITPPIVIIKQKPITRKVIKVKDPVVVKTLEKLNLIDNKEEIKKIEKDLFIQDDIKGTPVTKMPIDLDGIPDDLPEELPILPFYKIEDAPEFPGCDKGTKAQKKICFNKKMGKHVNRYFDVDLAQDLGLSPGKKRINVQFIIDEKGNITDIKSNAPHIRLQKEAIRIVKKLPKMIPGKQRNNAVKVKFNLPINFNVQD